jgi:hypothetical protein
MYVKENEYFFNIILMYQMTRHNLPLRKKKTKETNYSTLLNKIQLKILCIIVLFELKETLYKKEKNANLTHWCL